MGHNERAARAVVHIVDVSDHHVPVSMVDVASREPAPQSRNTDELQAEFSTECSLRHNDLEGAATPQMSAILAIDAFDACSWVEGAGCTSPACRIG